MPPVRNTNCAWVQHIIHHLALACLRDVLCPSSSAGRFG